MYQKGLHFIRFAIEIATNDDYGVSCDSNLQDVQQNLLILCAEALGRVQVHGGHEDALVASQLDVCPRPSGTSRGASLNQI